MTTTEEQGNVFGYFIDPEKLEEAERLRMQGQLLDKEMGLLPAVVQEQLDRSPLTSYRVLDVGCSSGGWSCACVSHNEQLTVMGIDISESMIRAAKAKAIADKLQTRVSYQVMDATQHLQFPDASFDLIHARLLFGFQTMKTWPRFLAECTRLLRPEGYLICCENDGQCWTTSTALAEFLRLGHLALWRNGNSYHREYVGIVAHLPNFMRSNDLSIKAVNTYRIDIGKGSPLYGLAARDHQSFCRDVQPYYVRMRVATQEELNVLYQQMLGEIAAENFNGYWIFTRVVGQKI